MSEHEQCTIRATEELRVHEVDGKTRIVGMAVPYGQLSDDLGGYRERMMPGAFSTSLQSQKLQADIEHDRTQILARSKKGTLGFHEDERGVWATITVPDTPRGRATVEEVRAGNLDGMSVSFLRKGVRQRFTKDSRGPIREVQKAELTGVTLTAEPAYPQTADTLVMRSLQEWRTAEEGNSKPPPEEPDTTGGEIEDLRRRVDLAESLV